MTRKLQVRIPIGIEKVLCAAASDPGFVASLKGDRDTALEPYAALLSDIEVAVLRSIPTEALLSLIGHIDVQQHSRNRFMRGILAATLLATSTVAVEGCEPQSKGISPDVPCNDCTEVVEVDSASRGIQPDTVGQNDLTGPDVVEIDEMSGTKGITNDCTECKPE